MTELDLGAPRALAAGAGPFVRLSAAALRRNIDPALRRASDESGTTVPALVADAWGHGETWVRSILDDAGVDAATVHAQTLYGLPGGVDGSRPVMSLVGRVLSTKDLLAGEGVSYGYAHIATVDTRIALITGGYAQGVVRALGDRVAVAVRGASAPIVGRVAMDVCVADIGESDVSRGDEAVFFGDPLSGAPSLSAWAAATGLGAGEIAAIVGVRVPREVVA